MESGALQRNGVCDPERKKYPEYDDTGKIFAKNNCYVERCY